MADRMAIPHRDTDMFSERKFIAGRGAVNGAEPHPTVKRL